MPYSAENAENQQTNSSSNKNVRFQVEKADIFDTSRSNNTLGKLTILNVFKQCQVFDE